MDLKYAREFGYCVKLLAVIKRLGEDLEVRVHPTMIPAEHVLASVSGVFNAVMVQADLADTTLYSGRGAGREPTASTVLGDIADVAKNMRGGTRRRFYALMRSGEQVRMRPIGSIETRHYLRMELTDKPGVLARISAVLGEHGIGIAAALQKEKESAGAHMPVVFVTHKASEQEMAAAVAVISAMDVVSGKPVRLRIEDI
jgi:homoserine dehydrogenase